MSNIIDVTKHGEAGMIKFVYDNSQPQGLGFLQATPEPLTKAEVQEILEQYKDQPHIYMDYVKGRACKATIRKEDGKLLFNAEWYDHEHLNVEERLKEYFKEETNG